MVLKVYVHTLCMCGLRVWKCHQLENVVHDCLKLGSLWNVFVCFGFTNDSPGTTCELPCKQSNWGPSYGCMLDVRLHQQQLLVQKIL